MKPACVPKSLRLCIGLALQLFSGVGFTIMAIESGHWLFWLAGLCGITVFGLRVSILVSEATVIRNQEQR